MRAFRIHRTIAALGLLLTVIALLVASAIGSARVAGTSTMPTAATNKLAAAAAVRRIIGLVRLPPGAGATGSDPSVAGRLARPGLGPGISPDVVATHRFWRVPGSPAAAIAWIEAHRPAGSTQSASGSEGQGSEILVRGVAYGFAGVPGRVTAELLVLSLSAAKRGGSALRADASAQWLLPRAASERIPTGIRAVTVTIGGVGGGLRGLATVTARATIRRLVAWVDRLPRAQPGVYACPAEIGPIYGLEFERAGGTQVASAAEGACSQLDVSIAGRPVPSLQETIPLAGVLWQLHALPVCQASSLQVSRSVPSSFSSPPGFQAVLGIRNQSTGVCVLDGYPRLTLRDAASTALPTHVSHLAGATPVVTLLPGSFASVLVTWPTAGPTCVGPPAATVDVRLPRVSRPLAIPVGSSSRPFAPCAGRMQEGFVLPGR